jgi:hypothetical protein
MKQESEDIQFNGRIIFTTLPDSPTDKLKNSVVPKVVNGKAYRSCGSVVSVTNFVGGADGQVIYVKGDGTTTIVHGTTIKTNTGANKLLATNRMYTFVYFKTELLWVEV